MQHPTDPTKRVTDMGWQEEGALWVYTPLSEGQASYELARLSGARSYGDTDIVSIQPCPNPDERSQDRLVTEDWPIAGGIWTFRAVFDGHAGHETVDFVAERLPGRVRDALQRVLYSNDGAAPTPAAVEGALVEAITAVDAEIGAAIRDLFPDEKVLAQMEEDDVRAVVDEGGYWARRAIQLALRGSTALISIADPARANLWVASLGDCTAALGTRLEGGQWKSEIISYAHNGDNPVETELMRSTHPGEPECIQNGRVLGIIAVTRALGDFMFKLPAIFTSHVLIPAGEMGPVMASKMSQCCSRNLTPPYVLSTPQTRHVNLRAGGAREALLIMSSDGLADLSNDRLEIEKVLAPQWVSVAGNCTTENKALAVLRHGMGGDDLQVVSRNLTVEMSTRWMDDTTVLVQRLF